MNKPLDIFLISCDWRDIFRANQVELRQKMDRDHLGPSLNNFFFLSFSYYDYFERNDNFTSKHIRSWGFEFFRPLLDLRSIWSVFLTVRKHKLKPHIWLTYDFGFLPALWLVQKFVGGQIVMVLTNQPRVYSRTRRFGRIRSLYTLVLEKLFYRLPNKFWTINETMKSYLKNLGVPENKIFIFYTDTIKRDMAHVLQSKAGLIRKKLKLPPGTKVLLSIARLEAEKNFSRLIELFSHFSADYVLVILGQGSLLPLLQKEAEQLGVAKRVIFEGWVERSLIWNYYRDADLFILLSKAEALGIVFWEAMYLSVPVVGSDATGIVETIGGDGNRGRIISDNDSLHEAVSKVEFCLLQSRGREQMLDRAKNYVIEKISNPMTLNDLV